MTPPCKPCYLCLKLTSLKMSSDVPVCNLCVLANFDTEPTDEHEFPKQWEDSLNRDAPSAPPVRWW